MINTSGVILKGFKVKLQEVAKSRQNVEDFLKNSNEIIK